MSDNYYVHVVKFDSEEVVEKLGPFSEWEASRVDSGMNINMNHDAYYTLIVEGDND